MTPCKKIHRHHSWLWLLPFVFFLFGCSPIAFDDWSEDEIQRVTSPDKQFDLVSYKASGGATTSFHSKLYLLNVGEKDYKKGYLIIDLHDSYPVETKWLTKSMVSVYVGGKKINYFTNYAYLPDGEEVRFVLK